MRDDNPLLKDFRNFLYITWKHLGLHEPTEIQYDIAWYLQHGPRRSGIEAFRGVGKSWITSAFVPWCLLRDPNMSILVVSASSGRANDFSTFVQRLIHEMPELAYLKPKSGQRDSKVAFDVGPAIADHAPSVSSKGITGQITGGRADLIIADDVEIPENCQTQVMREKLLKKITEFGSIVKPGGSVKYLGTPHTEQSIYNTLCDKGYEFRIWTAEYPKIDDIHKYGGKLAPIIVTRLEQNPDLAGTPTDPQRFSEMDLLERKVEKGPSHYMLQFMLDTSLSNEERYPLKLRDLVIMDLDKDLGPAKVVWASSPELIINDLPNVGMNGDKFYRPMAIEGAEVEGHQKRFLPYTGSVMFIDPSGRGADELAYAVVKIINGQLFLTLCRGLQGGYSDRVLGRIAEDAKDQKVNLILFESNFGDGMFGKLLQPVVNRVYPVKIEEVRHSKQKEARIIDTLEPVMAQHRLIVDKKVIEEDYRSTKHLPAEKQLNYQLFYQMTRITRERGCLKHDDRLDALAGAVNYWVEHMSRDVDQAVRDAKEQLLMSELEKFMEGGGIGFRSQNQWRPHRR